MFKTFNNLKLMFLIMMILSTMIAISSSSWLTIWIMMEINSMAFIPIMMTIFNMNTSESMMLYFLVQSISSMNFLFIILINNLINNWTSPMFNWKNFLMTLILFMKMGAAPFYFWFPKVMKNISWTNNFMLMTWQKIIPMTLIYYCKFFQLIFISILLSTLMGSLMALNQTNMKMIMSFSSINHMGWLMTTLLLNINIWLIYLMNYFFITYILCKMFHYLNIKMLNNIFTSYCSNLLKLLLLLNFFSLSGMPPFLGFFPKWITLMNLFNMKMYLLIFILIMTTLINLYFYLRIMTPSLILNHSQPKFMLMTNIPYKFSTWNMIYFSFINILLIPTTTIVYQII
uniref:NADH-ubiquinone oxidoreductase chain 2 n=1 Tax=Adicella ragma TaxID=2904898 RepID=A0A9E8LNM7_9NEOP|nr:NADH dehydrogenase subunit 2 [Adicella ragma]UZZ43714.1 NADH dehydrogenase subunit 2 [Adicella ragma]